ncbi:MAG: hypothetical protein JW749_03395 [Sedimentisphaerales bacterium]|nr:hypothetical protein [Sedimentisphaerales bacterium]
MGALKICLVVTGIACLAAAPGVFMPMSSWEPVIKFFGVELLPESAVFEYAARVMCATYAGIGIYFIILGLRPMKYGILVPFSGLVSVALGVVCIIIGNQVGMPPKWFLSDGLGGMIFGVLILLFWLKARKAAG